MSKHTEGPLSVGLTHHENEGKSWLTFSSQADILHPNGLTSLACVDVAEEEGEANARLYAAAPCLLAALVRLMDEQCPFEADTKSCECRENGTGFDDEGNPCEHIQARRAIAKATAPETSHA